MLKSIRKLFKPTFRVTIFLKNGQSVVVRAYEFKCSSIANDLKSIEYNLLPGYQLLYTRLDDVSCIVCTKE